MQTRVGIASAVLGLILASMVTFSSAAFPNAQQFTSVLQNHPNNNDQQSVQQLLRNFTENGEASVFAVLTPDGEFKFRSFGPVQRDSILRFGSITKMFVGQLALRYGLNLDAHPSQYGFNPSHYEKSDNITYRQVGGHLSGISEYADIMKLVNWTALALQNPDDPNIPWINGGMFSPSLDIDLGWLDQPLNFVPGSKYCYSNTNCELMGKTLELLSGGHSVQSLIRNNFQGLNLDDGSTPISSWPQTSQYLNWPFPPSLPSVSGTLIGTTEALVRAYARVASSTQFATMKQWQYVANSPWSPPECGPEVLGHGIAGGDRYGFFLQNYNKNQIYTGRSDEVGSVGHDGDLIARSQIILHPSQNIFFYHYTNNFGNAELQRRTDLLVRAYLLDSQ